MKKLIFKITSLILIALILSTITNEKVHTWDAHHTLKKSHYHVVFASYGKARDLYMQTNINPNCGSGCGDPCWKVGSDSSQECDINWLVPGLVAMASSIACGVMAYLAYTGLPPFGIPTPAGVLWLPNPIGGAFFTSLSLIALGISVYFLEHIGRVQWLADVQSDVDVSYSDTKWVHYDHWDSVQERANTDNRDWVYKIYSGKKLNPNRSSYEVDFGNPTIIRWIHNDNSLAKFLHMLGDMHAHGNWNYCVAEGRSTRFDPSDPLDTEPMIDDSTAKLGMLRVVDIMNGGPEKENLGSLSVSPEQIEQIRKFYNYYNAKKELFPNSKVFKDNAPAFWMQVLGITFQVERANPDNLGGTLQNDAYESALNNMAFYWAKYLHINHPW